MVTTKRDLFAIASEIIHSYELGYDTGSADNYWDSYPVDLLTKEELVLLRHMIQLVVDEGVGVKLEKNLMEDPAGNEWWLLTAYFSSPQTS